MGLAIAGRIGCVTNEGEGLLNFDPPPSGDSASGARGGMRERIGARDWSATALGPAQDWPPSLTGFVRLMLNSAEPTFLAWGPDRAWLYNDAFIPILGDRHPGALGRPSREVWAEAWPDLAWVFDQAFAGAPAQIADLEPPFGRHGRPEGALLAFSCSPAPDEQGRVAGVFGACREITADVAVAPAFREADERLELAMVAGGGVGAWDWDIVADRVYADARFAAIYSVDPIKASSGAPVADFFTAIHPDDRERVQDEIAKALGGLCGIQLGIPVGCSPTAWRAG